MSDNKTTTDISLDLDTLMKAREVGESIEAPELKQKQEDLKGLDVLSQKQEEKPEILDNEEGKKEDTIEDVVEKQEASPKTTSAVSTAKLLIEKGLIDDMVVSFTDDEEDEGKPISEIEDLTQDQLDLIIEEHKKKKDQELSSNYIDKSKFSEDKQKIIEILENGGDLSALGEDPNKMAERPFQNADLENKDHARTIYTNYVKEIKNLTDDEARDFVQLKESKEDILELGKNAYEKYQAAFTKFLDDKVQETKEKEKKKSEIKKTNKGLYLQSLKDQGIKDVAAKKLADQYYKQTDQDIEGKLKEILQDPEKYVDIITHILDPEAYKTLNNISTKAKVAKETVRLISDAASKNKTKGGNNKTTTEEVDTVAPWLSILNEKLEQ